MKEKLFKTGKASVCAVGGLRMWTDFALWLFIPLVAKPRAVPPWSAAASQVAGWICSRECWRLSLLEMVAPSSSSGVNFSQDFVTCRSSALPHSARAAAELMLNYLVLRTAFPGATFLLLNPPPHPHVPQIRALNQVRKIVPLMRRW